VLEEWPPGRDAVRRIYFPGGSSEGGHDGLLVRVRPQQGNPWMGVFAFGFGSKFPTGVFTCPDSLSLCVVAAGSGYIVRVDSPESGEPVRCAPVTDIRPMEERQLLLFADFTRLVAYGRNGVAWRIPRLSWDGLKITAVGRDSSVVGWDAVNSREVEFVVESSTGRSTGGASPE
jgi:hypothetical protein